MPRLIQLEVHELFFLAIDTATTKGNDLHTSAGAVP